MIVNSTKNIALNKPCIIGLKKGLTASLIVKYFCKNFKEFYKEVKDESLNEDELTQRLILILDKNKKDLPLTFVKENIEPKPLNKRRVDIGVYSYGNSISDKAMFLLEAKILPTLPLADRETEYLRSEIIKTNKKNIQKIIVTGGVHRFKFSLHGGYLGSGKLAMLAYIKTNDFDHWFNEINSWLKKLVTNNVSDWYLTEDLKKLVKRKVYARSNSHIQRNSKKIKLHHLFVKVQ